MGLDRRAREPGIDVRRDIPQVVMHVDGLERVGHGVGLWAPAPISRSRSPWTSASSTPVLLGPPGFAAWRDGALGAANARRGHDAVAVWGRRIRDRLRRVALT